MGLDTYVSGAVPAPDCDQVKVAKPPMPTEELEALILLKEKSDEQRAEIRKVIHFLVVDPYVAAFRGAVRSIESRCETQRTPPPPEQKRRGFTPAT